MSIEPRNLGIPLYKRSWTRVWFVAAAAGLGWLWHRPTNIPDSAVSFLVGGGVLWFVLASPVSYRLLNHHVLIVRGLWYIAAVALVLWTMSTVVPYLHRQV